MRTGSLAGYCMAWMMLGLLAAALSAPAGAAPYVIRGQSNVVVEGRSFSSADSACIEVWDSTNITLRNLTIKGCHGPGIHIENSTGVRVETSWIEDTNAATYALKSKDITIIGNRFKNVSRKGKRDGWRGQFVQFDSVRGALVQDNRGVNEPGKSDPEDLVNVYASHDVRVVGNVFRGGGPSPSGGGIMTGDQNGSNVVVEGNTLIDPGQYGVAIAGGQNIKILNNKVYGRAQSFTNVGLYVWAQYGAGCSGHEVRGNQVDYRKAGGARNDAWNSGSCGQVSGWSENRFGSVDLSSLASTDPLAGIPTAPTSAKSM